MRKRLTDTNPDDEEIARLRPELHEAKLFRDYLAKENKILRAKSKKDPDEETENDEAKTTIIN